MAEIWQVAQWLRDGGEDRAAAILEQCVLSEEYVDTVFPLTGDGEFDVYDIAIAAPRRLLSGPEHEQHAKAIEAAVMECFQAERLLVRTVFWKALIPSERHAPGASAVGDALAVLNSEHVHDAWVKALNRKTSDPEGAITAARTLLESVCKSILDAAAISYDDTADLPKLYNLTAQQLGLAPSQHTEEVFRQILGGCFSVVNGLATVRNRLSDAHGKGKRPARAGARHAELAVNLAGTVATFLVATWASRQT
jgi:hypothetical protein